MSQHAYEDLGRIWLFVTPIVLTWAYIRVLRRHRRDRLAREQGGGPATDPRTGGTSVTTRTGTACFWVVWLLFLAITCYLTRWDFLWGALAVFLPVSVWVVLVRLTTWTWIRTKWAVGGFLLAGFVTLFYFSF